VAGGSPGRTAHRASRAFCGGAWITSVASSGSLNEITIAPFGRTGAPVVVSASGGQNPIWARDSRSLYYHTDRRSSSYAIWRRRQAGIAGTIDSWSPRW
jgi:hypothetical protein